MDNTEKKEDTRDKKKQENIKRKNKDFFKKLSKGIKHVFGMRQTRYGTNTAVAILALFGILILANFIAKKENFRWDLTKSKKYTLSDQTKNVLKRVDKEIKVTLFYQQGNPDKANAESLLNEYKEQNNKIKTEFIDPDKKPTEAKKYSIDRYGTIVFEMDGKKEQAITVTESDLTSSILKLTREKEKKIYFLEGHGEKNIDGTDEGGYGIAKSSLEKEGYKVEKLSLLTKPEIPQDISVLVIAGPQKKLIDKEKEVIEKYVNEGGKLFLLLDPKSEVKESTGFSEMVKKWGVLSDSDVAIDPEQYFWTDPSAPVVSTWSSHQITDKLAAAFFPGVGEVSEASDASVDFTVTSLASTSANSWLERDVDNKEVKFDKDKDKKGPISIAVAVEKSESSNGKEENKDKKQMRLAVIGDSDFAVDGFAQSLGNQDFFLNSVDYLAEEEELISIRPKEEEERTVALTGKQSQMIFYGTVFGMPAVAVIAGILVWFRRKRKK